MLHVWHLTIAFFFCSLKSFIMSYDDGLQITKEGDNADVLQVLYRGNN